MWAIGRASTVGDVVLEAKVATNPAAMRQTFEKMPSSRIALIDRN
jgi:hypothetical protein